VGDPAAALVGTLYGRHKMAALVGRLGGNKSLEGSVGCFVVAAAATFTALMVERDFYFDVVDDELAAIGGTISLAAGVGAAAAELLDIGGWDDNLTLPLLSGVFLQLTVGRLL
jgi:diacylglycerol kinase (CTP)